MRHIDFGTEDQIRGYSAADVPGRSRWRAGQRRRTRDYDNLNNLPDFSDAVASIGVSPFP